MVCHITANNFRKTKIFTFFVAGICAKEKEGLFVSSGKIGTYGTSQRIQKKEKTPTKNNEQWPPPSLAYSAPMKNQRRRDIHGLDDDDGQAFFRTFSQIKLPA